MKTLFTLLLALTFSAASFSQSNSDAPVSLESIHTFCKTEMNGKLWFDYNSCDSNFVTIYNNKRAFSFKLTSIADLKMDPIKKKKYKSNYYKKKFTIIQLQNLDGTDSLALIMKTFPGAKIKMEYHHSHEASISENGGTVRSNNGLNFVNQISLYGNKEELLEFKRILELILDDKAN